MCKDTTLMVTILVLACAGCPNAPVERDVTVSASAIVGGVDALRCAGAATVFIDGCSATLIHPTILVTAAHCIDAQPKYAFFSDAVAGSSDAVSITYCGAHPNYLREPGTDLAFCVLAGKGVVIPYVPVIAACEPEVEARVGAALTLIGAGREELEAPADTQKRWVDVTVRSISRDGRELVTGDSQHGACHGDSGGSVYAKLPDASSRLVAVISRRGLTEDGAIAADCAGTTVVTMLRPHLAWLEAATGVDLTPCHDDQGWNPGPDCGEFASSPLETAAPANECETIATAPLAPTCVAASQSASPMRCSSAPSPSRACSGAAWLYGLLCAWSCVSRRRRSATR